MKSNEVISCKCAFVFPLTVPTKIDCKMQEIFHSVMESSPPVWLGLTKRNSFRHTLHWKCFNDYFKKVFALL